VTGTTIVALISVIASSIVALTGVIVPQVLGTRERRVTQLLAHGSWWRDTRSILYSEILSFCIRALHEELNLNEPAIAKLEGRVDSMGSPEVSAHFRSFMSALRNRNTAEASRANSALRKRIPDELWTLSKTGYAG
jgi:hypothetical protein